MSENLDDVYPPDDDDTRVGDRRYDRKERLIAWSVRQGGRVIRFRVQSFREVTLEKGENLDVPEAIECSFSDDDSASAGGEATRLDALDGRPFVWTGREHDAEIGMQFHRARRQAKPGEHLRVVRYQSV